MTTDDTARAILALTDWIDRDGVVNLQELQSMARLWLMRDEILANAAFLAGCEPPSEAVRLRQEKLRAVLDRVASLESE